MRLLSSARSLRRCAGQCATQRGGERITAAPCVMRNSRILVAPPGATGQRGNEKGAGGRPPPNGATRRIRTRRGTRWPRSPPSAWPASIQLPPPAFPGPAWRRIPTKPHLQHSPTALLRAGSRLPRPGSRPDRPPASALQQHAALHSFSRRSCLPASLPAGVWFFSPLAPQTALHSSPARAGRLGKSPLHGPPGLRAETPFRLLPALCLLCASRVAPSGAAATRFFLPVPPPSGNVPCAILPLLAPLVEQTVHPCSRTKTLSSRTATPPNKATPALSSTTEYIFSSELSPLSSVAEPRPLLYVQIPPSPGHPRHPHGLHYIHKPGSTQPTHCPTSYDINP